MNVWSFFSIFNDNLYLRRYIWHWHNLMFHDNTWIRAMTKYYQNYLKDSKTLKWNETNINLYSEI
jgi:hypothetical protein